jgi:hypothetical protein
MIHTTIHPAPPQASNQPTNQPPLVVVDLVGLAAAAVRTKADKMIVVDNILANYTDLNVCKTR